MTFKQLLKSITKAEWLFVAVISAILMVVTIFPIVMGYALTPEQSQYNGMNLIGIGDFHVYFSYINQVKAGNFLLKDYFTSEPQVGGIFNIFWLGVGLLARILDLTPWVAYHLSRLLMIPVFCIIFYIFSSYIFTEKKLRLWSLIFAAFSSGLGGFLALIINNQWTVSANTPIDLWVTESNIFFSIYENPHFILSFALMILCVVFLLLAWQNNNYKYSFIAGVASLIWFNFHPYYAPYLWAITSVYLVYLFFRYRKINYLYHWLIFLAIGFVSVGYHYYLSKVDFVIGTRMAQNYCISPSFGYVAIGFGFLLFFSLLGIFFLAKKYHPLPDKYVFLLIWLFVGLNLLYAPIDFNRRFSEGLQIPMIYLSVFCLFSVIQYFGQNWGGVGRFLTNKFFLVAFFAVCFCSSPFYLIARDINAILKHDTAFYFSDQVLQAVNWLALNNADNKVILSHKYTGHYLPGLINQQVYIGHGHETANFMAKNKMIDDFYANKYSQDQALKFLKDNNIGYIFYNYWEQGNPLNLYQQQYLEQVFSNTQTAIYKVKY